MFLDISKIRQGQILTVLLIGLSVLVNILFCGCSERKFSVTPNVINLNSDGGAVTLEVEGPSEWKILEDAPAWVSVDISDGNLNVGVSENNGLERTATLVIGNTKNSCTVTIIQESGAFYASPSNARVKPGSGVEYFSIKGQNDWIIAEGPEGWGRAEKLGNQLSWTYDENDGEEREDMVVLQAGSKILTVTLTQGAALRAEKMNLTASGSKHTSYIEIYGPSDWDIVSEPIYVECKREGNRVRIDFEKNTDSEWEDDLVIGGGGQEISISIKQNKYSSTFTPYYYTPFPYYY